MSIFSKNTQYTTMKQQSFICGIFILSLGTLISKFIGAIYRIPMTWMLGVQGLGIYQLVYPVFSLLLILSSTGSPTAISAMVSERIKQGKFMEADRIFYISKVALFIFGVFLSLLLLIASPSLAQLQGNTLATYPYMTISLAIPFVSILSAYRGYYQGCQNMVPTAISQIVEQLGKLIFGLILASIFLPMGIQFAVVGAFLGVVLGEVLAVIIILIYHKTHQTSYPISQFIDNTILPTSKLNIELLRRSTPIILASLVLPLLLVLDSMLAINLLSLSGFSTAQATGMWGIYSGIVTSIINMPIILTLSIATSIVPQLSTANHAIFPPKIQQAFRLTLGISLPCMLGILILSPNIITFLYADTLTSNILDEFQLSSNLLMLGSVSVILTAIMQIQNATLQSINHSTIPLKHTLIASVLKVFLVITLVPIHSINIYGLLIANIVFYLIILMLNQYYLHSRLGIGQIFHHTTPCLGSCCVMGMFLIISQFAFAYLSPYISLPLQILIGIAVYASTIYILSPNIQIPPAIYNKLRKVYKK